MLSKISRQSIQQFWSFNSVRFISGTGRVNSDSFKKREKAAEDQYMHEQEKEKINILRAKIQKAAKDVEELEKQLKESKSKK
ncbi:ATPase inhibitor [Entomophthora muscae]|uniref:ATPase inhibitor n=1 Tax=Entomophthora muscae TaxID=34485 RepID=A0ACC2TUU9_9FUNG|nr:ATPase inhibitor [Entomophthora muscae]